MTNPTPIHFDDPLEQELTGLQPAALPPRVRRGVAAELSSLPIRRPPLVLRFAAAGMAMAACIAVAVVVVHQRGKTAVVRKSIEPDTLPVAVNTPPPAPTLGELRLALARSPEAAEALLSGGGAQRAPTKPPRAFGPVASGAWPASPSY